MAVRLGSMPDPEMLFAYQFKVVLRGISPNAAFGNASRLLEKELIVVYSVWLHRRRDFSVPTPSVARAQHRI
jgi:hypothetical protein